MKQRQLGKGGPQVSAIGLGLMGMSPGVYGSADDAESVRVIHHALDIGVSFLDTANLYGWGHNEELLGKALRGRREQAFVATKFGIVRAASASGSEGTYENLGVNGRPEYVRNAAEESLKRLGVDCIDLYYQHRVDLDVPIEETWGAMAELVAEGKVRYLGISEASAQTIRRVHAVHPIAALQSEYSLWSRDIETDGQVATARELGIAIIPYSPLGRGFLSGELRSPKDLAPDDFRRSLPRFSVENFPKNLELVHRVEAIALRKNATPSQIALAWVLAQGGDVIPIPGTRQMKRLEENAGAVNVELTPGDITELESVFADVSGNRYPSMAWVNR